ncbi:MAG TPA: glycoside hydrolase family 78 protein [Candidatus Baltobacteraceae bacterium]|jgi:alpha-L-rhamnosidase|nr:glycoside hydrolase family 78 protein [Candidatus Baltobacteraceae bacterium]
MKINLLLSTLLLALGTAVLSAPQPCAAAERLAPEYLRCEYQVDPLGIDETAPRLSWRVSSSQRGQRQTAWRILVASSKRNLDRNSGDLWNSGIVADDETIGAVYRGLPLVSREICYWKVQVWDKDHKVSRWSQPAMWTMGLLQKADWHGQWIGYDRMRGKTVVPAPFDAAKWIWYSGDTFPTIPQGTCYFMSSLALPSKARIDKAELLVAAHDEVLFNINGNAVQLPRTDDQNNARLVDVTSQIKPGMNTIRVGVEVAASGPAGLIAKLVVVTDGRVTNTLVTDSAWRSTNDGGANWHVRPISAREWPAAQIIGPAGCLPWGDLKYSPLTLFPPPYLRAGFTISKPVLRATLYATALGLVDVHLNGHLVSQDRFTPGWTDYTKRVYYRTYDVTKLIEPGSNVLGAILADGWYSGYIGYERARNHYGTKPRFRGQLQIDYDDGSSEVIGTGPNWKASKGPIREADFLMGEEYDARMESHWDEAGFDDGKWAPVEVGAEMDPLLQADPGPPVRAFATLDPKGVTEPKPGVYVFDMGQNFAGVARLKTRGKRGQVITLRFGERLNPDGTLYTANLRQASATDTYTCRGEGTETWEPRFTYHGFQYVEVTGLDRKPATDMIAGVAISSATTDAGRFVCSDPMLNRLERNIYWTQRANFIDIPTDCPQRDERLGWMGDAQVYINAATLHEDVQSFFTKWLVDVQDAQRADGQYPTVAPLKVSGDDGGPAWADAGVICPWAIYEAYGDRRILERHYDSMARFIDFCKNRSTPDLLPPKEFQCFGDWLNISDETSNTVIYTAYFAHSTELMARIAEVLGKTADAARYNELFENIRAAFNRAYVASDGRIEGDTQTDYALALWFGLLDSDKAHVAARYLVENIQKCQWHLSTGFIGTKCLMLALAQSGRNDVAERLIHNDTFPSWGFSIKHGATSIWERWDGWTPERGFQDPGMNSFAHYSFGAVYQWMVENLGGIRSTQPAYKKVVIAPQFDSRVTSADTTYDSIRGLIETHWKWSGNKVRLEISIPANITATVRVPARDQTDVFEDGRPASHAPGVTFVRMDDGSAVFEVGSGTYRFSVK